MLLDDMISLLTALVGLFGAIFLIGGIRRGTGVTAGVTAGSQAEAEGGGRASDPERMAVRRANITCGAALVGLAFCLQILNVLLVTDSSIMVRTDYFRSFYWADFLLTCSVSFFLAAIALWKKKSLTEGYVNEHSAASGRNQTAD